MSSVVQPWLAERSWKEQSILFSSLRGPDATNVPNIKAVNRWARTVTQFNADPSKDYMKPAPLPEPMAVCKELQFLPCHYVHHFADGLAVIAYGHPEVEVSNYAARLHYLIAEELFHFLPESRAMFELRHRDKPDGQDPRKQEWADLQDTVFSAYLAGATERD